ncbi:MAG: energy-coupling factor transporter transmembrane component T [Myxococcota bacterium]
MTDPRVRLLLVFAVGAFGVLLDRATSLGALAGLAAIGLLAAPIPPRWRLRALGAAAVVVASTAWTQGLFYADAPRTAVLRLGPVVVWREGLVHGLVQSLRLVAMGLAGGAVALSTPPDRLFAGLVALRVPYGAGFLAVTALRFVPLVATEWLAVREARARRGRPLFPRGPWGWLTEEMGMLAPLAARTIRRARTLAESLEARGFDPVRPRRMRVPLASSRLEQLVVAIVYLALGAVVVAELLFRLYVVGGWYHPALRPLYGWVRTWL